MKVLQVLIGAAAAAVGLGLLGCDVFIGGRDHSPRETVYVEREPQPQAEYVIVREAPPAVIVERRPAAPSVEYIWIDGYWHWNSHQYVWLAGRWDRPPHEHYIWVAPRYERHEQGGYRYTPGQWREGKPEQRRDDDHRDKH